MGISLYGFISADPDTLILLLGILKSVRAMRVASTSQKEAELPASMGRIERRRCDHPEPYGIISLDRTYAKRAWTIIEIWSDSSRLS